MPGQETENAGDGHNRRFAKADLDWFLRELDKDKTASLVVVHAAQGVHCWLYRADQPKPLRWPTKFFRSAFNQHRQLLERTGRNPQNNQEFYQLSDAGRAYLYKVAALVEASVS